MRGGVRVSEGGMVVRGGVRSMEYWPSKKYGVWSIGRPRGRSEHGARSIGRPGASRVRGVWSIGRRGGRLEYGVSRRITLARGQTCACACACAHSWGRLDMARAADSMNVVILRTCAPKSKYRVLALFVTSLHSSPPPGVPPYYRVYRP